MDTTFSRYLPFEVDNETNVLFPYKQKVPKLGLLKKSDPRRRHHVPEPEFWAFAGKVFERVKPKLVECLSIRQADRNFMDRVNESMGNSKDSNDNSNQFSLIGLKDPAGRKLFPTSDDLKDYLSKPTSYVDDISRKQVTYFAPCTSQESCAEALGIDKKKFRHSETKTVYEACNSGSSSSSSSGGNGEGKVVFFVLED